MFASKRPKHPNRPVYEKSHTFFTNPVKLTLMKHKLSKIIPLLGGTGCIILFFLYGLANNLSMSYMGNTSEKVSKFILDNFLGSILIFILTLFIVYLIIGLILSSAVHLTLRALENIFTLSFRRRTILILNAAGTLVFIALSLCRDIILYPQLYMNSIHNKNAAAAFLFEKLTDNVHPGAIEAIRIALVIIASALILIYGIRRNKKLTLAVSGGLVIIITTILLVSQLPMSGKPEAHERPNILIIASDALRPDHLSGFGYKRDTSPGIDSIIAEGTSFRKTFIEVPRTFPSWISILTGEYASKHGVRHMFPTSRDVNRDFPAITKILREKGYFTSVVTDYAGDIFTRVDLGFENVDTPYFNFVTVIQQAIIENHPFLLPFLTNQAGLDLFPALKDSAYFCPPKLMEKKVINAIDRSGERPFFLTTFFSSTHFPYAPPYPYYKQYTSPDYKGPYKYYKQRIISLDTNGESATTMPQDDIEQIRALYDSGIRAMDDSVEKIIAHLKKKGQYDNTIIIVLADHGENIYEHEYGMGHGEHFRGRYAINIPLVIRDPKQPGTHKEILDTVRHIDIAPTILALAGESAPTQMEGRSLLPLMRGEKEAPRIAFGETGIWFDNSQREDLFFQKKRIIYPDITNLSEVDFHFDAQIVLNDDYRDIINLAKHRYVFDGRYKLIYMPMVDHVEYELYDTVNDPEERHDIAKLDPQNVARLKSLLFAWMTRNQDVIIKNEFAFPVLRY
jgi:arylsulfatase A-like enzyme